VAVFLDGYDRARDSEILRRLRESLGEDVFTLQFWPFASEGLSERTTLMFNIRNDAVSAARPLVAAGDAFRSSRRRKICWKRASAILFWQKGPCHRRTGICRARRLLRSAVGCSHSSSNAGLRHRKPAAARRRFFPM
jgi:hypothetical protein